MRDAAGIARDREALARTSPSVVLAMLRRHIRAELAAHEDCELDLRAQVKLAESEAARRVGALQDRMAAALEREAQALAMADGATRKLEDAHVSKETALNDTKSLMDQVKSDQLALVQQLRAKGEENERQAQIIADKDRLLKRQEVKMLQMASLESEIQSVKADSLLERRKLESMHKAKTAHFERDVRRIVKLEADNERSRPRASTQWLNPASLILF
jgi:hypothetical protein